ncbi:MAG: type IV pilus biogenesis/stability protein PilW [Pseudomonas sp.]|uniref:Type IV pilus biogenesis/stability protein PilW n=1 Tax=Pseudomonas nicosulfuronedens TaxID=2571105 RepID=A0A5R9QVM7_9PSED|nr:type IV pilus biogenesis/stability protein PilW [Pseudomonas nicosulfuronedens]MDH1012348.1 type IV pilus biogenesis/stability protein PilW [Pseudomonas nicosulfuronedens]MDH2030517.1 type IV pilus biogenesis/stability protein PilW [Pseudomonas nicosulfuronedens]TLX74185.1 type IV pilus biogenesis/stability protein PilW [Pseudomonas nicosulfuronedens]
MTLRAALCLLLATVLTGCVTTGKQDPLKTDKGRNEARDAYIQLGIGYLQMGNTEQAKVPLRQALDIDSSSADAHAALAVVYQVEKEPKLAESEFRKALSSRSGDARILNNYGGFLFEQKRYQEAYDTYMKATEDGLYSERSRVFENLGLVSLKLNNRAQAKEFFEKAIRLNRNSTGALLESAELNYQDREYVPARAYYEEYLKRGPQTARSLLLGIRLAKIYDDRDTAASYGLQLKRLYPASPEYQAYQADK